jgi:protease-4
VYEEIMRVRSEGKKVTVSMGDVAASGGYYIASAADRIYANPATLTGSIGVIMETADFHKLLGNVGVDFNTIKSGKHKDMGSFSRSMTPDERQILQGLINDVYDQFLTDVSKGRKLPKEDVRKLADGRVYTGRQAVKLKLVDKVGSLEDALSAAAKDAGIKGKFGIKKYEQKPGLLDVLTGPMDTRFQGRIGQSDSLAELAARLLCIDPEVRIQ